MSGVNKVPAYAGDFARLLWGDGQVRVGLGFSQQIYTPSNTGLRTPDPRDRPYAGFLAGTGTLVHETGTRQDILALTLGMIGPAALGEQVQNGLHRLVQVDTAQGWSHQLPNEGAVELLTQRTWRRPLGSFAGLDSDILPSLALGVGTVRDYVQTGAVFRIERRSEDYFATWISPVAIFPCAGNRDEVSERALAEAFAKGGWQKVTRLYRDQQIPEERCWLRGSGWSLAYS